jgi:hypothetical protein
MGTLRFAHPTAGGQQSLKPDRDGWLKKPGGEGHPAFLMGTNRCKSQVILGEMVDPICSVSVEILCN